MIGWISAFCFLIIALDVELSHASLWNSLKLPHSHIPYYFTNNPSLRELCEDDSSCPYKDLTRVEACWGYETEGCQPSKRLSNPLCLGDSKNWVHSKSEQLDHFWKSADFGTVLERRQELKTLCKPSTQGDSSLQCGKYLRYCTAEHIFIDLTTADILDGNHRNRYREDVLKPGQIGGHCTFDSKKLKAEGEHKSPLQSWFAEFENYVALPFKPSDGENCDIVFEKPTYLIKLDAGINMYHHFCDFVNLYASQHINNSFNTDVNIIAWDTSPLPYGDFFSSTWRAFSDHPVIFLNELDGKKICIKQAVFPLLARMRFGLFYNMPLIPGCERSSLMQAFSQHVLHRLAIRQMGPLKHKIRITLLVRETKYRKILNQRELASAMKTDGEFEVTMINFNSIIPFEEQLKISHNSDIFIGIHGSGLTHMLFQPDWAVIFELYNCEDSGCYFDLARLSGIKYMTWERKVKLMQEDEGHHPTLGAHAKFTNYAFDVNEFMRLIYLAADHVRSHPAFIQAKGDKHGNARKDPMPSDTADNQNGDKVEKDEL